MRIEPDEEQRHAMLLARQRKPPRCGEVERARIARYLSNHESEVTATQPLLQCEERIFRLVGHDMDQPCRDIMRQAGAIRPPTQSRRLARLNPQYGAAILCLLPLAPGHVAPVIEGESQCARRPCRLTRGSKDLAMQGRSRLCRQPRTPSTAAPDGSRGDICKGRERQQGGFDVRHGESTLMFLLCSIEL